MRWQPGCGGSIAVGAAISDCRQPAGISESDPHSLLLYGLVPTVTTLVSGLGKFSFHKTVFFAVLIENRSARYLTTLATKSAAR
jgi:hypothetical protein